MATPVIQILSPAIFTFLSAATTMIFSAFDVHKLVLERMCSFCAFMMPAVLLHILKKTGYQVWQLNRIPVAGEVPACHSFKPERGC